MFAILSINMLTLAAATDGSSTTKTSSVKKSLLSFFLLFWAVSMRRPFSLDVTPRHWVIWHFDPWRHMTQLSRYVGDQLPRNVVSHPRKKGNPKFVRSLLHDATTIRNIGIQVLAFFRPWQHPVKQWLILHSNNPSSKRNEAAQIQQKAPARLIYS